jgi:F-type H+-transporting ATPase subunit b
MIAKRSSPPRWAPHTAVRHAAACCAGAALLVAADLAWAAEEAHGGAPEAAHGNPWLDLLWKAINLAVLVAIIWWAARKPFAKGLADLAKATRDSFMSSRKAAEDMDAAMAEQKRKITGLAQDLSRMVADARADVEREKQRAQLEAQAQAGKIAAQTLQQIEQEVAKARLALRQDLAEQTVKLAEALIKQQVNSDEQKRLMADYLKQLESRP